MMPVKKKTTRRYRFRHADDLDLQQILELVIGPNSRAPQFDPWTRKEVYKQVRDSLLEQQAPGSRPWAWWQYEAPEPRSDYHLETQADQLDRLGLLSEYEVNVLTNWSRLGKAYAFRGKFGGAEPAPTDTEATT